jgi:membrane-associated protease RseP (regulator of RpoE activity)
VTAGAGPLPASGGNELERLKARVAEYFPVYETRITAYSLVLLVQADPATLEERFDRLRQELWPLYYVPQIRLDHGEYTVEVIRRPTQNLWGGLVNLVLLLATVVSTMVAGAFLWVAYRNGTSLTAPDFLWGAVFFAAPLLLILGLHELAHFWMARRHHVDASLPYFLPVPPPFLIFGTFGAFISLREPFPNRKALLDIGAAGPIAGFLVAIPVTLLGLHLSLTSPVASPTFCGVTFFGVNYNSWAIETPAFWSLLALIVPGASQNLHPLALAGWVGILVTAFNLLPAGQLDGGHVARALLGKRAVYASYAVLLTLGVLFVLTSYVGWLIFALFVFFVGMRHPPPLNDISPLGGRRVAVGIVAMAILVSGFTVVPLVQANGSFHLQNEATAPVKPLPAGAAMGDNLSFAIANGDILPHAYIVSGSVERVTMQQNGSSTVLSGPALAGFLANSTWVVTSPNGNVSTFSGTGSFSLPHAAYGKIDPGASGQYTVAFFNTQQATVTLDLVATQLCPVPTVGNTASWQPNAY